MPASAKRAKVSLAPALESDRRCGIERIALRAVTPFPGAHALAFLAIGFLHGERADVSQVGPALKLKQIQHRG